MCLNDPCAEYSVSIFSGFIDGVAAMSKTFKSDSSQFRGGRLARRARSFKDDFLGRINQMRSPSGTRAVSPSKNSKNNEKLASHPPEDISLNHPGKDIDIILRSVHLLSTDLRYFQDVVEKSILEMLPGSVTVILETVLNIVSVLRETLVNEQSSLMLSASNQVYQALANLIRWSDNILLSGEKAVDKENVNEIAENVRDAVKSLVHLSLDRSQNRDRSLRDLSDPLVVLPTPKPESPHRGSLPDIPLTPREREILEQTKLTTQVPVLSQLHHSASSDSILNSGNINRQTENKPPPKPPLQPFRECLSPESNVLSYGNRESAPPLPPKLKQNNCLSSEQSRMCSTINSISLCSSYGSINTELNLLCAMDWTSPSNQSPDNLTPFSKSSASSLNSSLNNSLDNLSCKDLKLFKSPDTEDFFLNKETMCGINSQTYKSELQYYDSTITSATTSSSLHSNDVLENNSELLQSVREINLTSSKITYSTTVSSCATVLTNGTECEPPALPVKLRKFRNIQSQYDNMPQLFVSDLETQKEKSGLHSHVHNSPSWLSGNHNPECPHHVTSDEPPPLPPKEKTIKAYMQMFGSYSQPSESEFLRHSVHNYKAVQGSYSQTDQPFVHHSFNNSYILISEETFSGDYFKYPNSSQDNVTLPNPPSIPPKRNKGNTSSESVKKEVSPTAFPIDNQEKCLSFGGKNCEKSGLMVFENDEENIAEIEGALDELEPTEYIIMKKPGEEGPDLQGGTIDALVVHATRADFAFQEAFLTTYRTFISPYDLICKLLYRYNKFIHVADMRRQRAARNAFALLVRVVDDLWLTDIHEEVLKLSMDFICQLVSSGDLLLARALRKKVVEKYYLKQRSSLNSHVLLSSKAVTTHKASLLDFKSESIAEQMTVLDADLFQKIEIPEVLLWAKEQKEDMSPNLTTFTEHFNKMSYWARSRILEQEEAKDREKYVVKFIKVMKHLRKLNNFNSYLALLSALDSAPIRRLEWQRNITEGLKEYCALIDSSSSFRAYRQTLAETSPPCIPYIGLILQDLTFVHIGNNDMLTEDAVNFCKRWQQFNILENMRRFKNCQYPVKRNEQIISFFNNFDDYLCEEAMWQISETIKPRGCKKKSCDQI